jgi:hypothetical protein
MSNPTGRALEKSKNMKSSLIKILKVYLRGGFEEIMVYCISKVKVNYSPHLSCRTRLAGVINHAPTKYDGFVKSPILSS